MKSIQLISLYIFQYLLSTIGDFLYLIGIASIHIEGFLTNQATVSHFIFVGSSTWLAKFMGQVSQLYIEISGTKS